MARLDQDSVVLNVLLSVEKTIIWKFENHTEHPQNHEIVTSSIPDTSTSTFHGYLLIKTFWVIFI